MPLRGRTQKYCHYPAIRVFGMHPWELSKYFCSSKNFHPFIRQHYHDHRHQWLRKRRWTKHSLRMFCFLWNSNFKHTFFSCSFLWYCLLPRLLLLLYLPNDCRQNLLFLRCTGLVKITFCSTNCKKGMRALWPFYSQFCRLLAFSSTRQKAVKSTTFIVYSSTNE